MAMDVWIGHIRDDALRGAVERYFLAYRDEFMSYPASAHFHHVYTGGLADHILEVLDVGMNIINSPGLDRRGLHVDRDHFIAAAILHDVGKFDAYRYDEEREEWVGSITDMRISHELKPILDFYSVTGYDLPFPVKVAILGHMGGWSTTSVYPDTMLGAVLSAADLISSKMDRALPPGDKI